MNKKLKLILIILASIIFLIVAVVVYMAVKRANPPEPTAEAAPTPILTPVVEATETPTHVNTTSAKIAIAGDVIMHEGLNAEAENEGAYDYLPLMGDVTAHIAAADYAACSLVTTFSPTGVYSAFPRFVSPDALAYSLSQAGFDLVNTATSHAVDSFKSGISYTLEVLEDAGLEHVGTYRSQDERDSNSGAIFKDINGIRIAFLSYTFDTNKIPISGFEYAVNVCTSDYLDDASTISYDKMAADIASTKTAGADYIIIFMSWGAEFAKEPNDQQIELSDFLIAQGADVIVGGHCRVPQPMDARTVVDINGNNKTGFVSYCLGNFLAAQTDEATDISGILNLKVAKDTDTGETWLSEVNYVPIFIANLNKLGVEGQSWQYRVFDLHMALASTNAGTPLEFVNDEVYAYMTKSMETLHNALGVHYDIYTEK